MRFLSSTLAQNPSTQPRTYPYPHLVCQDTAAKLRKLLLVQHPRDALQLEGQELDEQSLRLFHGDDAGWRTDSLPDCIGEMRGGTIN